jgi:hypothetical protein
MQRELAILALAWATASVAAQAIQVVPSRAPKTTEAQAGELVKATEAALRELSSLEVRPALRSAVAAKCAPQATACWTEQGKRTRENLALVVSLDKVDKGAKPTASLALLNRESGVLAVVAAAEPESIRSAVDGMLPPEFKKGQGGLSVELASGTRLKVDGRVVAPDAAGRVFLPVGAHEVDLLMPSGKALLTLAKVAEGEVSPLQLNLRQLPDDRRGAGPLLWAAGGLWATGAVAVLSSLVIASVANVQAKPYQACLTDPNCGYNAFEVQAAAAQTEQLLRIGNVLLWAGGGAMAAGVASFSLDVALSAQK